MSASIPHYDVIIIGAGSIGVPAAFYLAKSGSKPWCSIRCASVGQGSNKHAIGGIRATHSDPAKIRLCLRSIEIFSTWQECYGDDIEWYQGGYAFVAYREREEKILKDLLALQKPFGLNIDWLDPANMRECIPDLNPDGLLGGTFSPDDGNASSLLAIHAFYRQAVQPWRRISLQRTGDGVGHPLRARSPPSALAQAYTARTWSSTRPAPGPGRWAYCVGVGHARPSRFPRIRHHRTGRPFLQPHGGRHSAPMPGSTNFYFYQHITGQIMFCITPRPQRCGALTRQETSSFLPMVARRLVDVMPRLMNIRVRRTWRGLYPMTPDGFPIVGWSKEVEGYLMAVGMCGQGFMLGPGLGEIAGAHGQPSQIQTMTARSRDSFSLPAVCRARKIEINKCYISED